VDVSIPPGWFYHAGEADKVNSAEKLLEIYYASVGRGCNLLLNLPPDRRGRIHEKDVASLKEMRKVLDQTFTRDLTRGAKVTASNTRGNSRRFAPEKVVDGKRKTYWATDDSVTTPEIVLDLGKPTTFNIVRIREHIPLGQRVDGYALDFWGNGKWEEFASGTSIGHQKLVRSPDIITTKVRLRITGAPVPPVISEIGLFEEPTGSKL